MIFIVIEKKIMTCKCNQNTKEPFVFFIQSMFNNFVGNFITYITVNVYDSILTLYVVDRLGKCCFPLELF